MTAGRRLVDALAAVASRYEPASRKEKLRLLDALAGRRVGRPGSLARLHEALCFLQAYPDDPEVLERVDRALEEFPRRVARLRAAARRRLHDSGIANTTLDYRSAFRWRAGSPGAFRTTARSPGPASRTRSGWTRPCRSSRPRGRGTRSARAGWAGAHGSAWPRVAGR